jgi:hypothetical protein
MRNKGNNIEGLKRKQSEARKYEQLSIILCYEGVKSEPDLGQTQTTPLSH